MTVMTLIPQFCLCYTITIIFLICRHFLRMTPPVRESTTGFSTWDVLTYFPRHSHGHE